MDVDWHFPDGRRRPVQFHAYVHKSGMRMGAAAATVRAEFPAWCCANRAPVVVPEMRPAMRGIPVVAALLHY